MALNWPTIQKRVMSDLVCRFKISSIIQSWYHLNPTEAAHLQVLLAISYEDTFTFPHLHANRILSCITGLNCQSQQNPPCTFPLHFWDNTFPTGVALAWPQWYLWHLLLPDRTLKKHFCNWKLFYSWPHKSSFYQFLVVSQLHHLEARWHEMKFWLVRL